MSLHTVELLAVGFAVGWAAGIGFCIVTLEWFMRRHHLVMRIDAEREGGAG